MAIDISEFESRLLEPRLRAVKWIAAVVMLLLLGRFWHIQILHGGEWAIIAHHNQIRRIPLLAPRGKVLDRHGVVLLDNRESYNVTVIPEDVDDKTIDILASCLGATPESVRKSIKNKQQWSPFIPVAIKEDISVEELALLEERLRVLAGVDIEIKPQRNYPEGPVASHMLGYLSEITAQELESDNFPGYRMGELIGRDGLERLTEEDLKGQDGFKYKLVDARGREVQPFPGQDRLIGLKDNPPRAGNNIYLTIDFDLQKEAERLLSGKTGAIVMMAVHTGEVLAMASSPAYDPEVFIGRMYKKEWKKLKSDPGHPLLNRAIQGQYPPGSVFKLIVAASGLENGTLTPKSKYRCLGTYRFGKKKFRCWREWGHGVLDLEQAIVQSCDVFFYNAGKELGIDRIAETAHKFGLGLATGIDLLSEKPGLIPTTSWKEEYIKEPWIPGETIPCSIGQGYVLLTPLQGALIPSVIANGGKLYRPQLIKRIEDIEGNAIKDYSPQEYAKDIISEEARSVLSSAMTGAVNQRKGTAYWTARSDKIKIAGKTGTAQVARLEATKAGAGEEISDELKDHAWFVAFAPAEEPEVAIAVLVEHGGHGSTGAAPLAKSLLEKYAELRSRYDLAMQSD